MTRLIKALETLGLQAAVELDGRWASFDGDRCKVYVVEARSGSGFYMWCDDPEHRSVEFYQDAIVAIQAGLRRAARKDQADEA